MGAPFGVDRLKSHKGQVFLEVIVLFSFWIVLVGLGLFMLKGRQKTSVLFEKIKVRRTL